MRNKVTEHTGFHYLSTETKLYTLVLLELNIFLKMHQAKSKKNPSFETCLDYNHIILLCVDYIVSLSQNI